MGNLNRREFLKSATAATVVATASRSFAAAGVQRVFVGSNKPDGILAFDWNPATGELTSAGVAAKIANVDWITLLAGPQLSVCGFGGGQLQRQTHGRGGQLHGANGKLQPLSAQNSAAKGTATSGSITPGARCVGRLRRRQRGQFPGDGRQAEPGSVDGALHPAWPECRSAGGGARALRVVLARQPLRLHQRSGRRLHPHLLARCGHGAIEARRQLSMRKPGSGRARCTSIPTASPRTA